MAKTEKQTLFCTGHQQDHPISDFHKNNSHPRGYEYLCRELRNKMQRDRRVARAHNIRRAKEMGLLI